VGVRVDLALVGPHAQVLVPAEERWPDDQLGAPLATAPVAVSAAGSGSIRGGRCRFARASKDGSPVADRGHSPSNRACGQPGFAIGQAHYG
jgi:hypothetical protein